MISAGLSPWKASQESSSKANVLLDPQPLSLSQVKDWRGFDVARPAGILVGIVGALMGLTSFGYVRRRWFELFFTVHHLYVLFLLFLFWHLGEKNGLVFMLPGVFLFAFDRLQRAFHSWSYAGVMATKTMPDGSIQVGSRNPFRRTF
jgi:ferric-chelate reductase